jgi:hypothetical protein
MRRITGSLACFVALLLTLSSGAEEKGKAVVKADYAELSRMIHGLVVKQMPKEYRDAKEWGMTIPATNDVPLPRLRTRVRVEGRDEFPHGLWKRARVWIENPSKDFHIQVRDFKKGSDGKLRLTLDASASLRGENEWRQWQKGLSLFNVKVQADAVIDVSLDCDVALTLSTKKFPPEVVVDPKIADARLELREFNLNEVSLRRLGKILEGERAREIGFELKGLLEGLLKQYEPEIRDQANQAIAQSLRDGKGSFSAASLLKMLSPPKKQ